MSGWTPNPDCNYRYEYHRIFEDVGKGKLKEESVIKTLVLSDLYFITQFILEVPACDKFGQPFWNHPFVVDRCREVDEEDENEWHLDLWARWHGKSSILNKARTIKRICKYPEKCTMIVSHTRPAAKKHMRGIMQVLEKSRALKSAFPEIFYENPRAESPKWSEDDGVVVKRKSLARSEATVEAWGIKEGMPIGVHFEYIILDDLETKDDVTNPDMVRKVREAVDLTDDLRTKDGVIDVVGTPYSHNGVYIPFIRDKVDSTGKKVYLFRKYPATKDGTPTGEPVFMSKKELDDIRSRKGEYSFNTQQLINPTPVGVRKLEGEHIKYIEARLVPKNIFKFMIIDPAGDDKDGTGDAWAFMVVGVEPLADDLGASRIFITDAIISPMREEEAPEEIARMYLRNGMIMQVGVEKVGASTTEIHVANALAKKGRYISQENGTLVILRPAGINNTRRIEKALPWPFYNGKVFISNAVAQVYRDRLRDEADQFPFWHDDGLTCLSYLYNMISDYRFGWFDDEDEVDESQFRREVGRNPVTGY